MHVVGEAARQTATESLRARALRLLARREHSRAELRRKLAPHAEEGIDLEALLDDFIRRGWLSEERFVEQVVRAKAHRYGPRKIAHYLREKGVDESCMAQALLQARQAQEQALESTWRVRFGAVATDAAQRARQVRFLQARGFSLSAIMALIRRLESAR